MRRTPIPKYRRQREKGRDRAYVVLGGRRIHLGGYDTLESRERYARVIAEWTANGFQLPVSRDEITVVELIARFWQHAKQYYRSADGRTTGSDRGDRDLSPLSPHGVYGKSKACPGYLTLPQ